MDTYRVDVFELKSILNKMAGVENSIALSSARANLASTRPTSHPVTAPRPGRSDAMSLPLTMTEIPEAFGTSPRIATVTSKPTKPPIANERKYGTTRLFTAKRETDDLRRLFTAKVGTRESTNISTARSEQGDRDSIARHSVASRQAKSLNPEIYCGPCSRDGLHNDVEAYCVECGEYFCNNCIKHHKILKITKNHVLRQGKTMPIIKQLPDTDDEMLESCDTHTNERLQYFCQKHNEACCSVCATINHRQCKKVTYIPEINFQRITKQCMTMIKDITNIIKKFEKASETVHKSLGMLDIQKSDFQQAILKLHQDISNLLQRLEKEILRDMSSLYETEKAYTVTRAGQCEEAIETLHASRNALEVTVQNGIESKCFLQLKKTEKQVSTFGTLLEGIKQKSEDSLRFSFRPDDNMRILLKSVNTLGALVISQIPQRTATLCTEFCVKSKSDAYQYCDISGSVVLDDGQIVLVDTYNESLKLFDCQYNMVTQTKISAVPWDVTDVGNEQVIVSLPREKKLQYFSISNLLRPLRRIGPIATSKASEYYGVAYCQDRLYVTCPNDERPNIKVLDMQGKYLKEIVSTPQAQLNLSDPRYIAITRNGRKLYISDCGNNSIISVEVKKGGHMAVYRDPDNKPPGDLIIQPDGNVYFCGYSSNSIIQLSDDCNYGNELLGSKDGIHHPQSISYCPRGHRITVTMEKADMVKVFQLS